MTSKQNTTVRIVITESERDPHGEALYEHWRVSAGGPIDDSGPRSAKEDTKQPLGTSVDTMRSRTVPDTTGSTIIDSRVDGTSLKNTEIRRDTLRPVEKISQGQAEVTFTDPDQISNTDDDSSYNNERVTSPSAVSDSGSDIDDVRGNAEAVMYLKACALYRVTPSYHFRQCVSDLDVSMQHRTLGDVGIKAIATALVSNLSVRCLNLSCTGMTLAGLRYILDMLWVNTSIRDLNLSHNEIGPDGAVDLRDSLIHNRNLISLDITALGLRDDASGYLAEILTENTVLKAFHIGKNSLGEKAGEMFKTALGENTTLRFLDVSWNHFRQRSAIDFCCGLEANTGLDTLNLSWNGLGLEGCHELGKALKVNQALTDLDLSSNRINFDAFKLVMRGLRKNKHIETLKVGCNPLTTDAAVSILRAVGDGQCEALRNLDLTDVTVDTDFLTLLGNVKQRRTLNVKHGITLRHDELRKGHMAVILDTDDPLTILFECVKTKNLRLIDLLKNLDKDNSETLSREELHRGLEEIDIPLSQRSMDILMNKLDINRDGQVDFSELQTRYKEHLRRIARLQRDADVDLRNYKNFDRIESLREMVRLRLSFSK